MPIRVSCPSCGRAGRVPDNAVGRTIQCPACAHRYRLTPDMVGADGLAGPLKLKVPKQMMFAFDDHLVRGRVVVMGPPMLMGSLRQRMFESPGFGSPMMPTPPGFGTIPRPPSLRDRMGLRFGMP